MSVPRDAETQREWERERASQLFRRQRDASLAHLTPDEIAMHPGGHALLEAP